MADRTIMNAKDAVSASLAECFVTIGDNRYNFMQAINLEANFEKNKTEVPILGKTGKGNKATGWKGTGSATFHYNTSIFRELMKRYKDTGEDVYFDIQVTNEDPTSSVGRQTVILKDCNMDGGLLAKFDADAEYLDEDNSTIQFPVVEEGARLTLERKGTPGKLEFTVVKGPGLNFAEGDPVKLTVNGTAMFYGFVFKKKRDKGGTIDVVAYDQLRYLKNKDTITEEGLKASDLLKRIATDFRLNLGTVEDTGYTLETIVEENQTLFDMIQSALDETLMNTKQLYVLYDDAGKLTLKNINTMKLNLLIDEETGENFSYESSIDEQTYNKIKLAYNDEKTGKRELFIAQDGAKMNQWGVLQYFEEVQTKTGASAKADALLKLYDQKTRKLTIQNAFGDVRVRAGSAVVVALNLGDIVTNNYMVVNKVTHTFRGDEHMMELDLIGGEFIA